MRFKVDDMRWWGDFHGDSATCMQQEKNCAVWEINIAYDCQKSCHCITTNFLVWESLAIQENVEIQKNAVIGNRCKIQSHAFVCELVKIGHDCVVSHGAMFINDPFSTGGPARVGSWRRSACLSTASHTPDKLDAPNIVVASQERPASSWKAT